MSVRPFVEADIPQVANLFWNFMRGRKGAPPPEVGAFFKELYFTDNPCVDPNTPSVVYEGSDGKIAGFLAAISRRMSVCGQPIRAHFGGNFIVHPEARGSIAAMRLLGSLMGGNQELSLTDSANSISRHLLERIGWTTIVPFSIHWLRPLRPGHYAVYNVARLAGTALAPALQFAAKPFSSLADKMAAKLSFNPFRLAEPRMHASELDIETLLSCMAESRKGHSLAADYDLNSLQWILNFMERMPRRGRLRKVVVRDENQKILGWFIYYSKPGAVGEVVQIGGDPRFTKDVLDHLFHDAWDHGVLALHGIANSHMMPDLSLKNCLFTCRGGWMLAHSRKPELVELLSRGDAFFSRMDGEWCLDAGGRLTS